MAPNKAVQYGHKNVGCVRALQNLVIVLMLVYLVRYMNMKVQATLLMLIIFAATLHAKDIPLSDGEYIFQHKYAEHPQMQSIKFKVLISGSTIQVENQTDSSVWPKGLIDEGELFYHKSSNQWIIINTPQDKLAKEVGGCRDGPTVIDLFNKVYWSC